MTFRAYEGARDREAVQRIWRETGWLRSGKEPLLDLALESGHADVAEVDGEAECLVLTAPGTVCHGRADLPMTCVTAVTTSHVARRMALARRLTAQAVARDAAAGALVASLGMFEQGFYDRLGFGSGPYEYWVSFDPSRLKVRGAHRRPHRLTQEDFARVHAGRLARRRQHGACNLFPDQTTHCDMISGDQSFGLGFSDGDVLTHHMWCTTKEGAENGPYKVRWMAWRTPEQFHELLAVLASLGDQIKMVSMREPPGIQLQDLIDKPLESHLVSRGSEFEQRIWSMAYWQMRICDVPGCLGWTRLHGPEVRFNLNLTDPIEGVLPDDAPWRGVAGEYVVTLGGASSATHGRDPALPEVNATVNAFTRLWLGVRQASNLAITDDLDAPTELLERLDEALCLPRPSPDWDF